MARPNFLKFAFLTNSSSIDMAVDGSSTAVTFEFTVPNARFEWVRNVIRIEDGTITATGFGGLSSLTNGITIQVIATDGVTVLQDFTGERAVKDHSHLASFAGIDVDRDAGAGEDVILVRWTVAKAWEAIELHKDEIIRVTVRDDLTGISSMDWMIQGFDPSGSS